MSAITPRTVLAAHLIEWGGLENVTLPSCFSSDKKDLLQLIEKVCSVALNSMEQENFTFVMDLFSICSKTGDTDCVRKAILKNVKYPCANDVGLPLSRITRLFIAIGAYDQAYQCILKNLSGKNYALETENGFKPINPPLCATEDMFHMAIHMPDKKEAKGLIHVATSYIKQHSLQVDKGLLSEAYESVGDYAASKKMSPLKNSAARYAQFLLKSHKSYDYSSIIEHIKSTGYSREENTLILEVISDILREIDRLKHKKHIVEENLHAIRIILLKMLPFHADSVWPTIQLARIWIKLGKKEEVKPTLETLLSFYCHTNNPDRKAIIDLFQLELKDYDTALELINRSRVPRNDPFIRRRSHFKLFENWLKVVAPQDFEKAFNAICKLEEENEKVLLFLSLVKISPPLKLNLILEKILECKTNCSYSFKVVRTLIDLKFADWTMRFAKNQKTNHEVLLAAATAARISEIFNELSPSDEQMAKIKTLYNNLEALEKPLFDANFDYQVSNEHVINLLNFYKGSLKGRAVALAIQFQGKISQNKFALPYLVDIAKVLQELSDKPLLFDTLALIKNHLPKYIEESQKLIIFPPPDKKILSLMLEIAEIYSKAHDHRSAKELLENSKEVYTKVHMKILKEDRTYSEDSLRSTSATYFCCEGYLKIANKQRELGYTDDAEISFRESIISYDFIQIRAQAGDSDSAYEHLSLLRPDQLKRFAAAHAEYLMYHRPINVKLPSSDLEVIAQQPPKDKTTRLSTV